MPGSFPGRPGGEHDEPLLDMIYGRRPLPPGAPPEMHDLARMLAAAAGPAELGELTGETAALAAFRRKVSRPGTSPAALRSARRWLSGRPPRGRLPIAAALVAAAAGLGSTAVAAYAGVLPGPIQHLAHAMAGAPDSPHATPPQKHPLPSTSRGGHHTPASAPYRPRSMSPATGYRNADGRGWRHGTAPRVPGPFIRTCISESASAQNTAKPGATQSPSGLGGAATWSAPRESCPAAVSPSASPQATPQPTPVVTPYVPSW